MDADWWQVLVGTMLGVLGAGGVAWCGWWLNRVRVRKALALVLFFDAKATRLDWRRGVEEGTPVGSHALLPAWRALQGQAADLLPRELVRRLTELAWTIDRVASGYMTLYVPEGTADAWAMAARAERDLARLAGETFDPSTATQLAEHERRFGSKP